MTQHPLLQHHMTSDSHVTYVFFQGGREVKDFLKFLKRERGRDLTLSRSKDEL